MAGDETAPRVAIVIPARNESACIGPVLAETSDGRRVSLEAGLTVCWLSGYRDGSGQLVWRFEDQAGNRYRVRGRMPRMMAWRPLA